MFQRIAANLVSELRKEFPIVAVTGPRQSGKTTLVREIFQGKPYVSLEDLDQSRFAKDDPRGFLGQFQDGAILDEVQRCPDLLNYLQGVVDEDGRNGLYILTGSSQFELNRSISQSLAGRVGSVRLLPFSIEELKEEGQFNRSIEHNLFHGFYPRILAKGSTPRRWLNAYIETYLERDVRGLLEIRNRDSFIRFISLCAGNVGSLLNLSRIATDCSITVPTAKSWLSVLKTSYICFTLQPHSTNFRKRVVKTPKLYFHDVGLACRLLGIQEQDQLRTHPLRGNLFENMVISDEMKNRYNYGLDPQMYFWRDNAGLEIDLIFDDGNKLYPIEIKSGATFTDSWLDNLRKWQSLAKSKSALSTLVYGGEWSGIRSNTQVYPWYQFSVKGTKGQ